MRIPIAWQKILGPTVKQQLKKQIINCIFYYLCVKTYDIIFHIFYPMSSIIINCNIFTFSSIKLLSTIRSLYCGNAVYRIEKPKVETEVAFLHLLSPFIASVTGLLFCTTQKVLTPVKNLHLSLFVCICLKNKPKIDVIVLAKGFIEDLGTL